MDDESCVNRCVALIEEHHRWAMSIGDHQALKFDAVTCGHGLAQEDLASEAMVGLIKAANSYDPASGVPFRAYAIHRIRGAVTDAARRAYPLSRQTWEAARTVSTDLDVDPRSHRSTSSDPVASARARAVSLQAQTSLTRDPDYAESAAWVEERHPGDDRHLSELQLKAAIDRLPLRQREVILRRHFQRQRPADIALTLDVSESRVYQLHGEACRRIRGMLGGSSGHELGRAATAASA
jgi:RNA polymerase sigma factor for flagellar operon FliA